MEKKDELLDARQQDALLALARSAIARAVGAAGAGDQATGRDDPVLNAPGAAFVTLTQRGNLRGCIGHLQAVEALWDSVQNNAINAALHDPRFPPLAASELAATRIEISVLSAPQPLVCADADELLQVLAGERPGLILEDGCGHRATFLPQVWEQLPEPVDFLAALCRKAGLPPDAWKDGKLHFQRYGVQHFEET